MHLSDGVVDMPIIATTSVIAAGMVIHSVKSIKEEDIPKISLMTGSFFALSLISLPVGPTSIHPLLAGLLGVILGTKATVAIFIGLLLQATLFQHGGVTTIGLNTLLLAIPAICAHFFFQYLKIKSIFVKGLLAGIVGVVGCVILLVSVLSISSQHYSGGMFSVIRLIVIGYLPLVVIEGALTGFAVSFINRTRPGIISIPQGKNYI